MTPAGTVHVCAVPVKLKVSVVAAAGAARRKVKAAVVASTHAA